MKFGLIFSVVLVSNVLCGCSSVPDCDSSKVTDLVIKIATQKLESSLRGFKFPWKSTFTSVHTIRTIDVNDKTGAHECAAQIDKTSVHNSGKEEVVSKPITYTVEKVEGDDIYVSVFGL